MDPRSVPGSRGDAKINTDTDLDFKAVDSEVGNEENSLGES